MILLGTAVVLRMILPLLDQATPLQIAGVEHRVVIIIRIMMVVQDAMPTSCMIVSTPLELAVVVVVVVAAAVIAVVDLVAAGGGVVIATVRSKPLLFVPATSIRAIEIVGGCSLETVLTSISHLIMISQRQHPPLLRPAAAVIVEAAVAEVAAAVAVAA